MHEVEDWIMDQEYLLGFKDRKDVPKFTAGAGNIGKIDGLSAEQIKRKELDHLMMQEVWKRTRDVKNLKKEI